MTKRQVKMSAGHGLYAVLYRLALIKLNFTVLYT